jgi:hypothetical protein
VAGADRSFSTPSLPGTYMQAVTSFGQSVFVMGINGQKISGIDIFSETNSVNKILERG